MKNIGYYQIVDGYILTFDGDGFLIGTQPVGTKKNVIKDNSFDE